MKHKQSDDHTHMLETADEKMMVKTTKAMLTF